MSFFTSLKNKKIFLHRICMMMATLTLMSQGCGAYQPLITSNSKPTPILIELFQTLNLPAENIQEMNAIAQKEFLRKVGEERWHMKEVPLEKRKILPILEKLGVINEVLPSQEMYDSVDYIVIQGARVSRMQDRVNFLLTTIWPRLSEKAKKRVKIVFLSGHRKLDVPTNEKEGLVTPENSQIHLRSNKTLLLHPPITESDAARIIWDQMVFDETLRAKILFVDAPNPKEGSRPTAKDTIKTWLTSYAQFKKDPNSVSPEYRLFWKEAKNLNTAKILAISNNPYIPHQYQSLKNTLEEEGFKETYLETVGPKADPATLIAVHLDNIARWLYELVGSLKRGPENKK